MSQEMWWFHFMPVLGVGLYWWFGRGRPLGLLYVVLLALVPTIVVAWAIKGGPPWGDVLYPWFSWFGSLVMLAVAWRLPPTSPSGSRTCPFCAEKIQDAAVLCRFCKSDFRPRFSAALLEVNAGRNP